MLALHASHHAAVWSSKRPLLSVEDNAVPNYLPGDILEANEPRGRHYLNANRPADDLWLYLLLQIR